MTNQNDSESNMNFHQEVDEFRSSDADFQAEGLPHDNTKEVKIRTIPSSSIAKSVTAVTALPYQFVPLSMGGGGRTHIVSEASRHLMEEEVHYAALIWGGIFTLFVCWST